MADINRQCRITGQNFTVGETEQFLLSRLGELLPELGGEPLPVPTVHPFEGLRRMYVFGALRKLYRAKSVLSGQTQLTRYDPALGTKICTYDEFFSDALDNTDSGVPYDFRRPFFDQWGELLYRAVLPPLNRRNCEDSDYVNGAEDLVRCYLAFATYRSQDCIYTLLTTNSSDCVDSANCKDCQLCYGSVDLTGCYEVHNSQDCSFSQNLFGCYDCRSCHDCYGCCGLERAAFHIFNQPVSQDQFQQFIASKSLASWSGRETAKTECESFIASLHHRANTFIDCADSTGAYLVRCQNCEHVYNGASTRDSGYLILADSSQYCFRGLASKAEFCHSVHSLGATSSAYSYSIYGGEASLYCAFQLQNCSHCFGCIGLRGKSYCILNRQYSAEEYFELVPRIIAHMKSTSEWGEWFPPSIAPHSYQESSVHETNAPIPLETARERGYRVAAEAPVSRTAGAIEAKDLPEVLTPENAAALLSKSIVCEKTGQLYNFQRRELDFYLRHGIPAPRRHWFERMQAHIDRRELIPAV